MVSSAMGASSHESRLQDAASALARGDALAALSAVGVLDALPALVLKGIAYAQLGDLESARTTLSRAVRAEAGELVRARIRAALAEVALGEGDAVRAMKEAKEASDALARLGDGRNAAMQELVVARAEILLGKLGNARRRVDELLAKSLDADVRGVALFASAEIAVREVSATRAKERLAQARDAARETANGLLERTVAAFASELTRPIARIVNGDREIDADLFAVESASAGDVLLVDACRRLVVAGRATVRLARKPALFTLLRVLALAAPASVPRDELAAAAFDVKRPNASHRARLRVEIGRLRKELAGIAEPVATKDGYALESSPRPVSVLHPPADTADATVALLLADGAAWTAQAVADHANVSKRTALRALSALADAGKVMRVTKGKDVRYVAPARSAIASRLLLLGLAARS
jgi:hypothetical protein